MLGGATTSPRRNGWYAGDHEGNSGKKEPFWFQTFTNPADTAAIKDWNEKAAEIVEHAKRMGHRLHRQLRPGARCAWR